MSSSLHYFVVTERERERQTDTQADRQLFASQREREREGDRQTDRQTAVRFRRLKACVGWGGGGGGGGYTLFIRSLRSGSV